MKTRTKNWIAGCFYAAVMWAWAAGFGRMLSDRVERADPCSCPYVDGHP